jgi:hypothetical protein
VEAEEEEKQLKKSMRSMVYSITTSYPLLPVIIDPLVIIIVLNSIVTLRQCQLVHRPCICPSSTTHFPNLWFLVDT